MARAKSEKPKMGKEINATIHYFYTKYKNTNPDSTLYKSNYKIIESLFVAEEGVRVYTFEQVAAVLDYLYENNVAMTGLTVLLWPDLIRSYTDNDTQSLRYALERLLTVQNDRGFYGDKTVNKKPMGW